MKCITENNRWRIEMCKCSIDTRKIVGKKTVHRIDKHRCYEYRRYCVWISHLRIISFFWKNILYRTETINNTSSFVCSLRRERERENWRKKRITLTITSPISSFSRYFLCLVLKTIIVVRTQRWHVVLMKYTTKKINVSPFGFQHAMERKEMLCFFIVYNCSNWQSFFFSW